MLKNKQIVFDENEKSPETRSTMETEENSKSIPDASAKDPGSYDYWLKKVFEYESVANSKDEEAAPAVTERTTRRKAQARVQNVVNPKPPHVIKTVNNMKVGGIQQMLLNSEEGLTNYLSKWSIRWARPKVKEQIKNRLLTSDTLEEMKQVILLLNEKFSSCESLNKIISSMTAEVEKNKVQEEPRFNDDEDENYFGDEMDSGKKEDQGKPEDDDDENIRYKKISLRLWGLANEKLKRCWLNYTADVENAGALYFSAMVFCDIVNRYVIKKNVHYFSNNRTVKDYYQEKAEKKNKQLAQHLQHQQNNQSPNLRKPEHYIRPTSKRVPEHTPLTHDDLDKFKFGTRSTRSQVTGTGGGSQYPNNNKPPVSAFKDYDDDQEEEYYDEESQSNDPENSYEYKYISNNEKTRVKQDKLNELVVRRSERNMNRQIKKKYEEEKEVVAWEEECKVCGEYGNTPLRCTGCPSVFHLDCASMKAIPDGAWHCFECLEKIASQRQTRSSARRMNV
jgi:hypothetical protein